jgi:DNA-directed RNA polymerase subunit RPC12/RpoP
MAKKIIVQGTNTYRGHCHECGAEFTYEREDVHRNYVRGGEEVSCPCCGGRVSHFGAGGGRYGSGGKLQCSASYSTWPLARVVHSTLGLEQRRQ